MKDPLPDPAIRCPASGWNPQTGVFNAACRDIVMKCRCPKLVNIKGVNPNTGAEIDEWGCTDSYQSILTIDNTNQVRQTGAAIESFRNEMAKAQEEGAKAMAAALSFAPSMRPAPERLRFNDVKAIEGH
jgi:hypothetical protein